MESNKLFAAILIAGILAMLSGFVAKKIIHVEAPEENAFKIAALEEGAGAGGAEAAAGPEPILALLASADATKGQNFAKACAACHTFNKGEPARVGPNLYGIVNNHHAHMDGFAYSDAMTALKDKTWTYAEINEFIYNPKKHIPGTKMVFAGIKKPQDRANVIAYLRSLADTPAALPSESDIKAEEVSTAPAEDEKTDTAKSSSEEKKSEEKADEKKEDAAAKSAEH
ncbi:MAG TPA: cytochrome c family protein [Alphaproteobacteria bacterium]